MMLSGILLVDKPIGWTSHDVVAKVRSILRHQAKSPEPRAQSKVSATSSQLSARGSKIRVGHTGTLDPAATGLLILVIGSYTKKAEEFSKLDKVYEAELTLGKISSTGDGEGEIAAKSAIKPTEGQVRVVLGSFEGQIEQYPHAYSAIKIGGQRAYKLARQGKTPELNARKVTIYSISDVKYTYPKLSFTVKVSSGTYIRSLAEDIGENLGTGAYLSSLRRTRVGIYNLEKAVVLDNITNSDLSQHLAKQ